MPKEIGYKMIFCSTFNISFSLLLTFQKSNLIWDPDTWAEPRGMEVHSPDTLAPTSEVIQLPPLHYTHNTLEPDVPGLQISDLTLNYITENENSELKSGQKIKLPLLSTKPEYTTLEVPHWDYLLQKSLRCNKCPLWWSLHRVTKKCFWKR